MAIADTDIERLREAVSIADTIQGYVQLRRVGRNWVGLCPFHAEKSGSLIFTTAIVKPAADVPLPLV